MKEQKEQVTKTISQEEFLNIKSQYSTLAKNKQKEEKLNAKILEQIKAVEKAEGELLKERVKLAKLLAEKEKLNAFTKQDSPKQQKQEVKEAVND